MLSSRLHCFGPKSFAQPLGSRHRAEICPDRAPSNPTTRNFLRTLSSGALIVLVLLVTSCAPEQRRAGTRVDSDLWQQIDGASSLESIE
ncbi:MAG: hypothetical protein K0U36_04770, partial [Alphaproteobacteria bacterium]|nr:hypothetical protein [Alphaproteobacteria bacterium]